MDIRGGQRPEWDSEVRFTVLKGNGPGGKNRKLEVACYCQEPKTEDLLGRATVDISDTLKTGEFDGVCCTFPTGFLLLNQFWIDWVSLDVDGVVRGDIYLEMTYYANAPARAAPKNKLLAPAQGSALGRRPSKLSPSDRLSRPIQQKFSVPSRFPPKQPSQLQDRINPTSSHLNNAVPPPPRKNSSLLALLRDEPVHASSALPDTHNRRSLSPQAIQSQPLELPSILRPGLGGHSSSPPSSDPRDFVRIRSSSDSSNNKPYGTDPVVSLSQLNPYIGGGSAHTPAHTGLSNNVGTSSNPYTGGSGAYIAEQQHQQAFGRGGYSPAPPGAFIPGNRPAPDGRSYSSASLVSQYTGGSGAFISGDQQQQVSAGRGYSSVQSTMSVQASGSSYPSVPITVSSLNQYTGNGGHQLPENQLGHNVALYPPPSPAQTDRSSSFDYSAPKNPYTGTNAAFVPGSQQAPDREAYSSPPPADTAQTLGYANYVIPQQVPNGPSLSYNNAGTEASSVSSGPFAFSMPIPTVMESYGHSEPSSYMSSHYQPPLPPRTSSVDNNRRSEQDLDPYHLARYRTPLPLPPGSTSIKEIPLPPLPPLPPTIASLSQVSPSPPEVVALAPVPDATRVEALRKVEQDAAWRKEQELKDLELAMQLDRELNL